MWPRSLRGDKALVRLSKATKKNNLFLRLPFWKHILYIQYIIEKSISLVNALISLIKIQQYQKRQYLKMSDSGSFLIYVILPDISWFLWQPLSFLQPKGWVGGLNIFILSKNKFFSIFICIRVVLLIYCVPIIKFYFIFQCNALKEMIIIKSIHSVSTSLCRDPV